MSALHNRWLCLLLTCLLLISCIPAGAITARAEDYPNTYQNTGNQRADIIGVALTQKGYLEGKNNYTKYGEWFGHPNMAWCGAFICWCANQANIPTSVIKKNGFANAASYGLPSFTVDDRLPQGGDLFFKNDGSHTGLVYYIEGDYFWTIEGNTYANGGSDGVYIRKHSLYGEYYFASPNYQSDGSSQEHSYVKGMENAHPHKEYYKCTHCGNLYYTGGKGTVSDCKDCQMDQCSHEYESFKKINDSAHSATCGKCGKKTNLDHKWTDDEVLEPVTCENPGVKTQKCKQCEAAREVTIPQTNEHQYSEWARVDENKHARKCETCGREQVEAHVKSRFDSDVFEHWYVCDICGDRGGNTVHTFSGGCESACTECAYVSSVGHVFPFQWQKDHTYHWQECENCPATEGKDQHDFVDDCDSTCDTCGYVRQVIHEYPEELESNATGHWHRCTKCDQAEPAKAHKLGAEATEDAAQYCTECGYMAVPPLPHVHEYAPYAYDGSSHWGTCRCGEEMPLQEHIWDFSTQACEICGSPLPEIREDTRMWFMLLGAGIILVLLIMIAIVISAIRRNMMRAAARAAFQEMEWEEETQESENQPEPEPV